MYKTAKLLSVAYNSEDENKSNVKISLGWIIQFMKDWTVFLGGFAGIVFDRMWRQIQSREIRKLFRQTVFRLS